MHLLSAVRLQRLRADRRGITAVEFGLMFPGVLIVVFGLVNVYSLLAARRAMDFGVERALRYAAVHAGGSTASVGPTYFAAAGSVYGSVGTSSAASKVLVATSSPAAGTTNVSVTATYTWNALASFNYMGPVAFASRTLTATGSIRVMN